MLSATARFLRAPRLRVSALPSLLLGFALAAPPPGLGAEADDIAKALALQPGARVADVGAGEGRWTLELAQRVGNEGRVWATEVDAELLEKARTRLAESGYGNAGFVLGSQTDTGLPAACCDAILLRLVYHHFTDPPRMRASLFRALRPGGRIAVIEVTPKRYWRKLAGVPDRGGHGIEPDDLVAEMTSAGFDVVSRRDDWPSDDDGYCVVFGKPVGP